MQSMSGTTGHRGRLVVSERTEGCAYGALFETHGPALRRYACRIVRSREQAEDIVQDVFLQLWLAGDRVELGAGTRSYLYIATRTRALTHLRRLRVERRRNDGSRGGDADPVDAASTDPVSPAEHEARDRSHRIVVAIERVLDTMPPRQREVATQRLWQQRTTPEIASRLGISTRTVELYVGRAMKTLRTALPGELLPNDAQMTHE
jgi:RNA polymerase sigma-70 factor (ECF subfamily)